MIIDIVHSLLTGKDICYVVEYCDMRQFLTVTCVHIPKYTIPSQQAFARWVWLYMYMICVSYICMYHSRISHNICTCTCPSCHTAVIYVLRIVPPHPLITALDMTNSSYTCTAHV